MSRNPEGATEAPYIINVPQNIAPKQVGIIAYEVSAIASDHLMGELYRRFRSRFLLRNRALRNSHREIWTGSNTPSATISSRSIRLGKYMSCHMMLYGSVHLPEKRGNERRINPGKTSQSCWHEEEMPAR